MEPDDGRRPDDERAIAERRVGAAVLEFLRDQPFGDGAGLRTWIATARPFADADATAGVEVLTFHAAKGREWPVVVVTGVETSLVPHRSATTNAARAEEARLLHVAVTRPADRLVITWAARRGGYRRQPSPLIAGIDTGDVELVPPPPELRREPAARDHALDALARLARRRRQRRRHPPRPSCAATATSTPSPGRAPRPPTTSPPSRRSAASPPHACFPASAPRCSRTRPRRPERAITRSTVDVATGRRLSLVEGPTVVGSVGRRPQPSSTRSTSTRRPSASSDRVTSAQTP